MKLRIAKKVIKRYLTKNAAEFDGRFAAACRRWRMHLRCEQRKCDHKHYSFREHGRRCSCGTLMFDPGD